MDDAQRLEQSGERADRRHRARRDAGRVLRGRQRLDERDPVALGELGDARLRPVADAALGHVEDPAQVDRVGRVGDDAQIGQGVLDLAALVEAGAADDLVGQADPDEDFLDRARHRVGPIEDSDVLGLDPVGVGEVVDATGDERGLVVLGVGDVADDLGALAASGPQVLRAPGGVLGDDAVRGLQDRLGRAVVLLEQDRARIGIVGLELDDVTDRRAAEGVDRLVGVTDDDELGGRHLRLARRHVDLRGQLPDQHVLRVVRVLVLIDEHVPEAPPVVLGDVGEGLQDVDRRHDEVVEIERVGLPQTALIHRVGLREHRVGGGLRARGGRLALSVADAAGEGLLVDELVLEVAHLVREAARRVPLGIEVELAHHRRHEALAVGRVVDREVRLQPNAPGLAAQDPHARTVERADPHGPGARPDEGLDALAHLARGLVREGDRKDLARLHIAVVEQVGDPVRQHARLARTGARDDEQRRSGVDDGLALLRVEPGEQLLRIRTRRRRRGTPGPSAVRHRAGHPLIGSGARPGGHPVRADIGRRRGARARRRSGGRGRGRAGVGQRDIVEEAHLAAESRCRHRQPSPVVIFL